MKIRNRLSVYFTAVSAVVLLVVQAVICLTFRSLIKSDFYDHLLDRAHVAAQLYLEADEISADSLTHVRERYFQQLPAEVVRFYNDKNSASFIKDRNQFWTAPVIEAVRKRKQMEFGEGKRQTVGIYYYDNQGDFVILVSAIDLQGSKRLRDLVESMIILWISVAAGLFLFSRWFAQKALEPMDNVIKQMRRVRAGNLSLRVDEGNGKDEISALAHNFNQLLEHLENAFELQQNFIINASHELRTPITTMIGEIEIALNKSRTNAEYDHVLHSVLNDAERLNETINSLLELANVDMNYTQPAHLPVSIDELIWELKDYWSDKLGKGMFNVEVIELPENPDQLQILANKSLLTIAFNNVIGNAFKFSQNKPVTCTLNADSTAIKITVKDSGVGILPDELEKVFESFYRGTNVNEFRGNGVGLYVTNKIIRLFNGSIFAKSSPGNGTTVTIEFKK
jgi:signal transduction histidine kinase